MFSNTEEKVLKILGRKKMTITEVTEQVYGTDRTLNGNNTVAATFRRIALKCKYSKLKWTITGEGMGRGGRTVWRVKR